MCIRDRWGTEVIFGRAKGFRAAMMRVVLRGASWLFRLVVLARLYLFPVSYTHLDVYKRQLPSCIRTME